VNFNNVNPFTGYGRALVANNNITSSFGSPASVTAPSAPWKAPAWCARWPNRT
jgi:hypothetical protein